MEHYDVKRAFQGKLATGFTALALSFVAANLIWPIWSLAMQKLYLAIAGPTLTLLDAHLTSKLTSVVAEGTFFWMVINTWIWMTLVMNNYGKTYFTDKQPWAGIWYTLLAWFLGVVAFLVLISLLGIWWKPFSLTLMFTPQSVDEIHLAIEGWETSNFYALSVIIAQIPLVSLLLKWPFAGKAESPTDGYGVLAMGIAVTWIVWMAMIVPSWMKLSLGHHEIVAPPFGNWPAFIAFCQAYVIFAIMPVEGGELYPMRFFAKRQPWMGIAGFVIAVAAGFVVPPVVRAIIEPMNLVTGPPIDVVVSSLELSVIVFMLAWHHLFDDYPSSELITNQAARVLIRIAIWFIGGTIYGVIWIKTYTLIPYGSNDLGMGVSPLGILAGQFALLMTLLFFNTFFDKWPLVRKIAVR